MPQDLIRLQESMHHIGTAASFGFETLHNRIVKFDSAITRKPSFTPSPEELRPESIELIFFRNTNA